MVEQFTAFAAEKATTQFVELACCVPTDSVTDAEDVCSARTKAKARNLDIMSGRRGEKAVRECFAMLKSYSSGQFNDVSLDRQKKHELGSAVVKLIADSWFTSQAWKCY